MNYLFRGKTGEGKWVEGNFCNRFYYSECYPCIQVGRLMYPVDEKSVGMWTGLTDKNGVNIFEGDVLLPTNPMDEAMKVFKAEYVPHWAVCPFFDDFDGFDVTSIGWAMEMGYSFEVIGNCMDNPELMEESE